MDKKNKQHRQKVATPEELNDLIPGDDAVSDEADAEAGAKVTPPGASFDTEEGRAAQGMRRDLGGDPKEPPPPAPAQ